ncbi:hypothetical protein [Leuconostoc citreum]|uniref:hypothetical protein n=1 Tax=Leuconostoc citreum TaxID=33964 RepID=UPI0002D508F3|nr:hypothetical protein [Leuconostoc citreum]
MTKLLDVFSASDKFEDEHDIIKITKMYQNSLDKFIQDLEYLQNIKKYDVYIEKKHILDKDKKKAFANNKAIEKNILAHPNHETLKVVARVNKNDLQREYNTSSNIFVDLESFLKQINNSIFESIQSGKSSNKKVNIKLLNNEIDYESDYLIINSIRENDQNKSISDDTQKEVDFFEKKGIEIVKLPSVFSFYSNNNVINTRKFLENFTTNIADKQIDNNSYVIRGLKIITIKNKPIDDSLNLDKAMQELSKLWVSLIDDNRYDDKLKFVKESLAVHLPQESDFNYMIKIVDTVKEYVDESFKNYVQNSITLFVEQESKLMSTFDETSQKIYALIDDLTKRLRELLVGFIGIFLITFIDKNHDIISKAIINIALLAYAIYSLFILFVVINYGLQKKGLQKNFKRYEKKVENLLPKHMIEEYKKNYVSSSGKQFTIVFVVSIILIVLFFSIFAWTYLAHRFGIATRIIDIIKWFAYEQ